MEATGVTAGGKPVTFPQYLLLNAKRFAVRPAMRFKDYGIWQSWSWSEQRDEIRDLALGLKAMGISEGDRIAIVGSNRPRLYWAFCAAQSLKAVPVPVYADSVAEEMAYVLNHAGVRFAIVQDQEQVDKIQSMAAEIPQLTDIIFDEPRGLRDYDRARLHDFGDVQDKGRGIAEANTSAVADWEAHIRGSDGSEISAILYTSGTTGRSKGVMLTASASVKAAEDTAAFDHMSEHDEVLAYLPLAWVGDHYLNYAQGYVAGLCMSCPESPDTVAQNLREIGP
ncbi:MAG: AMP-binding protein, partial [Hoeflea sp.]|nr:AMP-binding protein [Hoeflea sp.]